VKAGKVYATATEDMDSLTFGSNVLLRYLTYSEAKKMPIKEFHLDKILDGLSYTMDEVRVLEENLKVFVLLNLQFLSSSIYASCWAAIIVTR
jgi:hypothetical protein